MTKLIGWLFEGYKGRTQSMGQNEELWSQKMYLMYKSYITEINFLRDSQKGGSCRNNYLECLPCKHVKLHGHSKILGQSCSSNAIFRFQRIQRSHYFKKCNYMQACECSILPSRITVHSSPPSMAVSLVVDEFHNTQLTNANTFTHVRNN